MTTKDFVNDLRGAIYCRIATSPIHGVGVFAIRRIVKGVNPILELRQTEFISIPVEMIRDDPGISSEVKKLVVDMCPENEGVYDVPDYSLNEIGISYYLNHSDNPNMATNDGGDFYALRDIEPGEELTVSYGTYGALNL